jgi:UDP-N-acetylmuramate dehydrogenase
MGRTTAPNARLAFLMASLDVEIKSACVAVKVNEPMSKHTSLGIGGPADYYADVYSRDELVALRRVATTFNVPVCFVGAGSNMLVTDKGIRGLVIHLHEGFRQILFNVPMVKVGAAAWMPTLAKQCAERGLTGVESLIGVPGTVGGGLVMNAGTREGVIGDLVESVEVLEKNGQTRTISKSEIQFGYRFSNLANSWIISTVLRLKPADRSSILLRVEKLLQYRADTQPIGTSNCGSVFKNPPKGSAGQLIEQAGFKGLPFGGAQVSERHANFIINTGGATAEDVRTLIRQIQDKVFEMTKIRLEPEIKLIGEL